MAAECAEEFPGEQIEMRPVNLTPPLPQFR